MKPIRLGQRVHSDGEIVGTVIKVVTRPAKVGQGAREEIYVDWTTRFSAWWSV